MPEGGEEGGRLGHHTRTSDPCGRELVHHNDLVYDGTGSGVDFQKESFGAGWSNLTSVMFKGAGSVSGNDSFAIDNLDVNVIPEPATLSLLGLGLGGLGLIRRRRKARH